MAASQEHSTLQGNLACQPVTTALFKNLANSVSGTFQLDSCLSSCAMVSVECTAADFSIVCPGLPEDPPIQYGRAECAADVSTRWDLQRRIHTAAKAVWASRWVFVGSGMLMNFGHLKWEAWEIQPDAKGPHWVKNLGINFFRTELKLVLITESYIPQLSCNFKRTIKV